MTTFSSILGGSSASPTVEPPLSPQESGVMKRVVSRLFDKQDQAEAAVRELESMGIPHDDLSIVARHAGAREARSFRKSDEGKSDAAEALDTAVGAGEGLATGGLIG